MLNNCIKLPDEDRPRERLEQHGAESLTDSELLAIILRTGSRTLPVLELSRHILSVFGSLHTLKMATLDELRSINGIGKAKSIELKAVLELGKRLARSKQEVGELIVNSSIAGRLIQEELQDAYQEHLVAWYLNTKNYVIKKALIFKGSLNMSVAHPREIFREAVRISAARIIVGHNHPSGILDPSAADIQFTKRLQRCGELMGIELLDHIIVSSSGYISLSEEGYLDG